MAGVQRLGTLKVAFNLGQYLLGGAVIVAALHPLVTESIDSPLVWLQIAAPTVAVGLTTMVLVAVAIWLAEGIPVSETVHRSALSSVAVTLLSVAAGITIVALASPTAHRR